MKLNFGCTELNYEYPNLSCEYTNINSWAAQKWLFIIPTNQWTNTICAWTAIEYETKQLSYVKDNTNKSIQNTNHWFMIIQNWVQANSWIPKAQNWILHTQRLYVWILRTEFRMPYAVFFMPGAEFNKQHLIMMTQTLIPIAQKWILNTHS